MILTYYGKRQKERYSQKNISLPSLENCNFSNENQFAVKIKLKPIT